jgi:hypothetical protein
VGWLSYYTRRYEQALYHLRRAIAMNPTSEDTYRVLSVLTRTPGTLKSMLEGLPSSWTVGNEGPETVGPWKPYLPVLTR